MPVMELVKSKFEQYKVETEEIKSEADRLWEEAWDGSLSKAEKEELREKVWAMDDEAAFRELVAHIPAEGEGKVSKAFQAFQKDGREISTAEIHHWGATRLRTLEMVNMWREEFELPRLDRLPKGIPGDSGECVIARALTIGSGEGSIANIVNTASVLTADGKMLFEERTLPSYATDLIDGFDHHREGYEDLELRGGDAAA